MQLFLRLLWIFLCLLSTVDQNEPETSAVCVCVSVWLLATEPFSLFLWSIFFLPRPVYLLKLPMTDAPISLLWTNGSQCVTLSLRLLQHQLRCKRQAGWVGVLCASPPSSGPRVTLLSPDRGRAVRLGVRWGWGECRFASAAAFFFLQHQSVWAQLGVLCHERSAASLLNQTLQHWLVLRAFTLNSSNTSQLM